MKQSLTEDSALTAGVLWQGNPAQFGLAEPIGQLAQVRNLVASW